jgi:hypothetical protein
LSKKDNLDLDGLLGVLPVIVAAAIAVLGVAGSIV